MTTIPLRQAQALAHLQGTAPLGEWFYPNYQHFYEDIGVSKHNASMLISKLQRAGWIQTRKCPLGGAGREVRVIRALSGEEATIKDCLGHQMVEVDEAPPAPKPRILIPYAGKDRREMEVW